MKKINLVFLAIIAITVTVIFSCKKEEVQMANQASKNDLKIEQQIQSFLTEVENPLKAEKLVDLDSVVWYTEAALNYNYAFIDSGYEEVTVDSLKLQIKINPPTEKVKFSDMVQAYQYMKKYLRAGFEGSQNSQKHLLLVDVYLMKAPQNTTNMRELMVKFVKTYSPPAKMMTFGSNDYWRYGGSETSTGGYCSGTYSGTNTNLDAAKKIQGRINMNLIQLVGTYFTDVYTDSDVNAEEYLNSNDVTSGDNMYDYLMFANYTLNPNYHECLVPSEMNFYLNGTNKVLKTYTTNGGARPVGLDPILVLLYGDSGTCEGCPPPDPFTPIKHVGNFKYGIKHYSSTPHQIMIN